jgi:transposase
MRKICATACVRWQMRASRWGWIAEALFVSVSNVSKVLGRQRCAGETTARPKRCQVPRKLTGHFTAIQQQVETGPDATIAELRYRLLEIHKVSASATLNFLTAEAGFWLAASRSPGKSFRSSNRLAPLRFGQQWPAPHAHNPKSVRSSAFSRRVGQRRGSDRRRYSRSGIPVEIGHAASNSRDLNSAGH